MVFLPSVSVKRACVAIILLAASHSALPQSNLPQLGDGQDLSLTAERKIGQRIAREIYRDPDYIDDPLLLEYVQSIWLPLLAAGRARGDITPELDARFAWQVVLARDRTVNAFALPGGYMGVHLGLIGLVATRDELASVLAHELAHITQRHIARLNAKQAAQAPWLLGAIVLGALAASKNPEAANAVIAGGQAVSAQNQLNFSRDMEREADRIGFNLLTSAGFAPQGFVAMFDKLQQANRINDNGSFPYLRSHPLTSERMGDMQARLQLSPGAALPANAPAPNPLEHALMATRARILADTGVDTLRAALQEALAMPEGATLSAKSLAAVYGGALAAMKLRELATASQLMAKMQAAFIPEPLAKRAVQLLGYEISLAAPADADNAVAAQNRARTAIAIGGNPARRPELLLSSAAHRASGQPRAVLDALQTWVSQYPSDAPAWDRLAEIYQALGQPLRAITAQAQASLAREDLSGALDRLKAGQALVKSGAAVDHIEASIIDTRVRAVESALREQALER